MSPMSVRDISLVALGPDWYVVFDIMLKRIYCASSGI